MYNFEKERKRIKNRSVFLDLVYNIIITASHIMVTRPVPTT